MNALIDGIDIGSALPQDRLKFMVYQRRMFIETLKNKTMFMMQIDPAKAADMAKTYVELAMPVNPEDLDRIERSKQRSAEEIAKMPPIPLSQVKIGMPMNQPYVKGV